MIPVAVVGTDVVAPPGKKFGTFTRPIVRFGKPLDFSRYEGLENDRYILRSITDEIMYEIMNLSGQEYVDMYAGQAKEQAKEESKRLEREAARSPRRPTPKSASKGDRSLPRSRREEEGVLTLDARPWWRDAAGVAVQDGMFRALAVLRVLLLANTVALNVYRARQLRAPDRRAGDDGRHGGLDGRRDLGVLRARAAVRRCCSGSTSRSRCS